MLIKFSIENWMSFKEKSEFSMLATREKQHSTRISEIKKYETKILPIASIYGANASGKSSFVEALFFIRKFLLEGTPTPDASIATERFCLDDKTIKLPSSFEIDLLVNEDIYSFSFSVTNKKVTAEKLIKVNKTTEETLYTRTNNKISLGKKLNKDERLKLIAQNTRPNQLFLTNSIFNNHEAFKPVYNWFNNNLILISPNSFFWGLEYFIADSNPLFKTMNEQLKKMETGILELAVKDIAFEDLPINNTKKEEIEQKLIDGQTVKLSNQKDRFSVTRIKGKLIAKKIISYHKKNDDSKIEFDIGKESDGTKKLLDIMPAILVASTQKNNQVVVIDELDRSLHSLLTNHLINLFLSKYNNKRRSQLIFTTHDLQLMTQDIFRRDEMWATEKNKDSSTSIFPFSDFKDIRKDKDIRKSYLQGRLGGIADLSRLDEDV